MRKFTLFFCSLLMAVMAQAQIIHVPADYPTIQLGIDAATPGDTVLVAEGTYYEQINFLGKKPLTVASQFLMDGDTMHVNNTIIDGSLLTNPENASVVYFISGEDTTSVLCGFTIRNGHGTRSPVGVVQGGGIWILNSGATISNNRITGNRCEALFTSSNTGCFGGGIGANSGLSSDWVIIQDNRIDSNSVVSHKETGLCGGGGIACGTNTRIVNNVINFNIARKAVEGTGFYTSGGAIYNMGSTNETLLITGNTITGNQALGNFSCGGAIACSNVLLNLSHNRIINNHVGSTTTISNLGGGGLVADNCLTGSVIRNNLFQGNSSEGWSGALNYSVNNSTNPIVIIENNYFLENHADAWGGAIGINDCRLKLINNVFSHNEADYAGIGYVDRVTLIPGEHTAWLVNNTFSFNKTNNSYGGLDFLRTNPLIMNSIFWQNNAPAYPDITISSGFAEIAYSNIDTTRIGGIYYKGPGITNADPLYSDTTNLVPEHWSPAVDAGIGSYVCMHNNLTFAPLKDISGSWRPKNQLWDMGAYELGHIIHVPVDFPKIQLGMNAALPGDTVLVADGTYYEQIDFLGKKPLMVASEFLMDGDTSHISNTIIDGSLLTNPDSASVVYFVSGEDTTSVLCWFTIQHGRGTFTPENFDDLQGGGIWISDAGAKIIHNRITHNTLDDRQAIHGNSVGGAGIGAKWADGNYWLVIGYNTIDSNTCISKYDYAWGGGICSSYNTRLFNNIISYNTCSGVMNAAGQGAGIGIGQDTAWTSPVGLIAANNTITHNVSQAQNNFANGAGAIMQDVSVFFSGNEVADNMVTSGNLSNGGAGGVLILVPETGSVVRNNVFKENVSNVWSGGLGMENNEILENNVLVENNYFIDNVARTGGAFVTLSTPCTLLNNVFSGNHAQINGGAIYMTDNYNQPTDHFSAMVNNSFCMNSAQNGGAVFAYYGGYLVLNNIFWQDSANTGREIYKTSFATFEIAYSNIDMDGITGQVIDGGGNLNEEPLFTDSVLLTTEPFSPCIDAGVPIFVCSCGESNSAPLYDITGVPRPAGIGFDMGAYDQAYSGVGIRNCGPALAFSVRPNPCFTSATFTYALTQPAQVLLRVYDNLGRPVATLVNGPQQPGEQMVEWDTKDLPAGVYHYRIMAGNQAGSGKMVKL